MELSTRPEDCMGSDEDWEMATKRAYRTPWMIMALNYVVNEGDGAFYGPKIDFHLEDCHRTGPGSAVPSSWISRCPSDLSWSTSARTAEKHRPIMIHRVCLRLY